jgi:hypothetical protein
MTSQTITSKFLDTANMLSALSTPSQNSTSFPRNFNSSHIFST